MVDPNVVNFSRWTFSLEAGELNNELNLLQDNNTSELPEAWQLLMQYISSKGPETSDDDIECLTDSSISTDVDEEEWEDLRAYIKECEKWKESSHDEHISPPEGSVDDEDLVSGNSKRLIELSIEGEEASDNRMNKHSGTKVKRTKAHTKQPYNYNVFSQILCTQEVNESEDKQTKNDVVSMLKDAVTKEEPNTEEIAELLRAPNVTKQHVAELWAELESIDSARLCLCSVMGDYKLRIVFLCQKLLTPWLSNGETEHLNEVVRKVSAVIPKFSDAAIKHFISPLIMNSNTTSPFTKDTYLLQDIMSHLEAKHWMLLFNDLMTSGTKLEKHHMPLLKSVIEFSGDLVTCDPDALYRLFGLINLSMSDYAKDRDFGLLITAIIDCVAKATEVSPNIIQSLKVVTDSYKGPMRFKIANLMKQFK